MKETESPPPEVKIFRIEKMRQDAWMKKYAGNFVGTIVFVLVWLPHMVQL